MAGIPEMPGFCVRITPPPPPVEPPINLSCNDFVVPAIRCPNNYRCQQHQLPPGMAGIPEMPGICVRISTPPPPPPVIGGSGGIVLPPPPPVIGGSTISIGGSGGIVPPPPTGIGGIDVGSQGGRRLMQARPIQPVVPPFMLPPGNPDQIGKCVPMTCGGLRPPPPVVNCVRAPCPQPPKPKPDCPAGYQCVYPKRLPGGPRIMVVGGRCQRVRPTCKLIKCSAGFECFDNGKVATCVAAACVPQNSKMIGRRCPLGFVCSQGKCAAVAAPTCKSARCAVAGTVCKDTRAGPICSPKPCGGLNDGVCEPGSNCVIKPGRLSALSGGYCLPRNDVLTCKTVKCQEGYACLQTRTGATCVRKPCASAADCTAPYKCTRDEPASCDTTKCPKYTTCVVDGTEAVCKFDPTKPVEPLPGRPVQPPQPRPVVDVQPTCATVKCGANRCCMVRKDASLTCVLCRDQSVAATDGSRRLLQRDGDAAKIAPAIGVCTLDEELAPPTKPKDLLTPAQMLEALKGAECKSNAECNAKKPDTCCSYDQSDSATFLKCSAVACNRGSNGAGIVAPISAVLVVLSSLLMAMLV
jgi:hypothetical protein